MTKGCDVTLQHQWKCRFLFSCCLHSFTVLIIQAVVYPVDEVYSITQFTEHSGFYVWTILTKIHAAMNPVRSVHFSGVPIIRGLSCRAGISFKEHCYLNWHNRSKANGASVGVFQAQPATAHAVLYIQSWLDSEKHNTQSILVCVCVCGTDVCKCHVLCSDMTLSKCSTQNRGNSLAVLRDNM